MRLDLTAGLRISRISDFILSVVSWKTDFDFDAMRQIYHGTIALLGDRMYDVMTEILTVFRFVTSCGNIDRCPSVTNQYQN